MKILITVAFVASFTGRVVFAQGTVAFQNFFQPIFFAPDYLSDGTTKLSGSQYMAELLAGPSSSSLTLVASTAFLSGSSAGLFNGGTQTVPNVPGGSTAFAQVDIWNTALGTTFGQAQASGLPNAWAQSAVFPVTTGSPDGGVPTTPGILSGLSPLSLNVPEPSTLAMTGFGAVVLLIHFYRRRNA